MRQGACLVKKFLAYLLDFDEYLKFIDNNNDKY